MNQPSLSVIVPVKDRPDDLERCLECLANQDVPSDRFEIVVVDDGSAPENAKTVEEVCARYSNVVHHYQENTGPAGARNQAVRLSKGELILFTDSDTEPCSKWVSSLIKPFENENVIGVEGPVRPPCEKQHPLQEAPRSEGGVYLTANIAYRRDVFFKCGGFDETFKLAAFEDIDFAAQALKYGEIVFTADALVVHPWRSINLKSSIKRFRQLEYLLITTLRYGYLGWNHRPTKYPRARLVFSSMVTLPLGRIRSALPFMFKTPWSSLKRCFYSVVEAGYAVTYAPKLMFAPVNVARKSYV